MTAPDTNPPLRVILVEDDDAHAELVTYAIEASHPAVKIIRFSDGEDAWQFLNTQALDGSRRPQLMFVDINMPKMGGLDLLDRVKKDDNLKWIPAVVLTTSSSKQDRQRAADVHANSYLVKPMRFDKLSEMMKITLEYWAQWNHIPSAVDAKAPST